jgi:hypothetical protein
MKILDVLISKCFVGIIPFHLAGHCCNNKKLLVHFSTFISVVATWVWQHLEYRGERKSYAILQLGIFLFNIFYEN